MIQYRIVMIDDDRDLLNMLRSYFELKNYSVTTADSGMKALEELKTQPDLILLDINMPGMDGLTLCRQIRDKVTCPILFLTAKVEEQDRVNGLLSGGDDYILKPFSLRELEARITAHLKREERHRGKHAYRFLDGLSIDYSARTVTIGGQEIELTKAEYDIVEFLSENAGQVFDKERIYERVYGYDAEGDSRGITEQIRRIRNKFSAHTDTEYIETVWGMGYRWKR